jgi:hypothetical protein
MNGNELPVFFSLVGQGIWYLQHVEHALNTFLTVKGDIKEIRSVSEEEGEKILSKHRRNTLGTSMRIAKEKGVLSKELMSALNVFKEERDWLVHRSMNENGDDLYLNKDRQALFERLEEFAEQAKGLQKMIAKELEDYVVGKGVSREWIQRCAILDINRKKGLSG